MQRHAYYSQAELQRWMTNHFWAPPRRQCPTCTQAATGPACAPQIPPLHALIDQWFAPPHLHKCTQSATTISMMMLLCICFLTFGSYWVYDTPGPPTHPSHPSLVVGACRFQHFDLPHSQYAYPLPCRRYLPAAAGVVWRGIALHSVAKSSTVLCVLMVLFLHHHLNATTTPPPATISPPLPPSLPP